MRNASSVGTGILLPGTEPVNKENRPAALPLPIPRMPEDLARKCLADAVTATIGLLNLLAANLANDESTAALLENGASRTFTVALIRETGCRLNEALSDAKM